MNNKIDKRQSNIELLRIVAMFAILFGHFIGHGYADIENIQSTYKGDVNLIILSFISVHVNLFLLITGYFGIKLRWMSFIRLFIKCFFYALIIYILWALLTHHSINITIIIKRCLFFCHTSPWWFIENYFYLMLFSPLLNKYINSLNKNQYLKTLFLLSFINVIIGGLFKSSLNVTGFTIHHFIFIYFIGGYIRRYGLFDRMKSKNLFYIYLICSLLHFVSMVSGYEIIRGYINPFTLLGSIVVFCLFLRVKINNNIINWIASSSLAVYLLHDEDTIMRNLYIEGIHYIYHINSEPYIYLPLTFVVAILFFIIAILIDKFITILLSPITNYLGQFDIIAIINRKFHLNNE